MATAAMDKVVKEYPYLLLDRHKGLLFALGGLALTVTVTIAITERAVTVTVLAVAVTISVAIT